MQLRSRHQARLVAVALATGLLAAACAPSSVEGGATAQTDSGSSGGEVAAGELSGSVAISGSSTVEPISALNAEIFEEENPGVGISVNGPGTGDGFAQFCEGRTDISDASRPIKDAERENCEANGIEFVELKVAIDGISVLTSPNNEAVECLDFASLYALTGPEAEGLGNWSAASGLASELGSTVDLPDAELKVVGPGEESGTYDTFVELTIEDFADERGQDAATRPDYQASPSDNVIVQGIQGSDTSLGWVGYSFYVENQDSLKALAVDDGESGCVAPTEETIASGEYPLARPLFIYVNTQKAEENPAVASYVDFYLSDEGLATVSEVGYVALPEDEWAATAEAWANR